MRACVCGGDFLNQFLHPGVKLAVRQVMAQCAAPSVQTPLTAVWNRLVSAQTP